MTPEELYNRAVKQMNLSYTSGISCIENAETEKSIRFFRDYTQGEIKGIKEMTTQMYLGLIYNIESEDNESESIKYENFCTKIREKAMTLRGQIIEYASEIINENIVE